jgi:amidase
MNESRVARRDALKTLGAGAIAAMAWPAALSSAGLGALRQEEWHWMSLQEIGRLIAARQVSPVELTRHMLDRIDSADRGLHSYATVMADQAMAEAAAAEREISAGKYRGPLHGVPVAVKDLCYTRGVKTMGGTPVRKNFVPDFDATVVTKIRAAGGVMLGKLNLTEGAMIAYHADMGIPLNPWNRDRWPGGSSSGSGVATAAGLCFAAIGTDTGGSIRFPSSANGVAGLKPTYGRVSRFGVLALSDSLDHVGPMARSAADAAILFDAIAGHDAQDPTSLTDALSPAFAGITTAIKGLRIGIDREYAFRSLDAGQAASIEDALKVLAGLGARIVDVRMPDLTGLVDHWIAICVPEALAAHRASYPSRASEYGAYFRDVLGLAAAITPQQTARAQAWRSEFTMRFSKVLDAVDAMACPAGGAPAWPITRELQLGSVAAFSAAWDKASPRAAEFTMPMNLAGTPAICVPSGFSPGGLPYSIQFAGRRLSEPMLCRIAHAYQRATTWSLRRPNV